MNNSSYGRSIESNHEKLIIEISLFRYYPIFLITSSLLLAFTFSFYTYKKKLLDHLTRIMRHFAGNMLIAFLVLSINQVFELKESSEVGCYVIGKFVEKLQLIVFRKNYQNMQILLCLVILL